MTGFEAVGVLEKHPILLPRRARPELRYLRKRNSGKRKDEVWRVVGHLELSSFRSLPCVRCAASHKLLFRWFEHTNVMSGFVSTTSLPQGLQNKPETRPQGVICRIASQRRLQAWPDFCRRG